MRCSFTKHSGIFLPSFWRSWVKREDVLMAVVSNQFSYFECQLLCSFICFFFPLQIYLKNKDLYTVEANNPRQLVEIAARDIEKLLSNRSKALVVSTNWLHFLFTIKIHTYICIFESRFFFFFLCLYAHGQCQPDMYRTWHVERACDFVVENELIS